jgi:hypothetical protein
MTPPSALVDIRRQKWRANYAKRAEKSMNYDGNSHPVNLDDEMGFLSKVNKHEEMMSQYFDLAGSLLPFIAFWLVGAVM